MFEIGNLVRIKSEWCDRSSEHELVYAVIDVNDYTKRCIIRPNEWDLPLVPTEVVSFEMIEKI